MILQLHFERFVSEVPRSCWRAGNWSVDFPVVRKHRRIYLCLHFRTDYLDYPQAKTEFLKWTAELIRLEKPLVSHSLFAFCGQSKYLNTCTSIHAHIHETRHKSHRGITRVISIQKTTTLWHETGPKALNQEKLSTPNWCLDVQNGENAQTVLDHQLRVRLLNLSWWTTDYGVARSSQSKLTVVC